DRPVPRRHIGEVDEGVDRRFDPPDRAEVASGLPFERRRYDAELANVDVAGLRDDGYLTRDHRSLSPLALMPNRPTDRFGRGPSPTDRVSHASSRSWAASDPQTAASACFRPNRR